MAWTTGTATDYADLLDELRAYLVTQGWVTQNFVPGTIAGGGELITRGPGVDSDRRVFVEIRTENPSAGVFSWRMRGATGYVAAAPEGTNPGVMLTPVYANLVGTTISYWFFVNDRRFIVVAKSGTTYASLYAGFFLPWGTPTAYPFPLYISGTYFQANQLSLSNSAHRFFADPGSSGLNSSTYVRDPTGNWLPIANHNEGANTDRGINLGFQGAGFTWPYSVGENGLSGSNYLESAYSTSGQASGGFWDNLVTTRQNEYGLFPVSIHANIQPPFGVLDGAFAIGGIGLSAEQSVAIGARNFTLFPNISRSSGNDFVAIERI
jgi:hypothetical protein